MMPNEIGFPHLPVTKKSGAEHFRKNENSLDLTLLSFWRWSASDIVNNATRGVLAEYIVANALGLAEGVRGVWDAVEVLYENRAHFTPTVYYR